MPDVALPPDDPTRLPSHARPDATRLRHIALAGDSYTILLAGKDTAGRYCLIDMYIPPGGGPSLHRHDFEEMFTVLDGEIEATFRVEMVAVRRGGTINIPADAPHAFINAAGTPARLLCMCSPPGQEEFFTAIGAPFESRTTPPPELDEAEQTPLRKKLDSWRRNIRPRCWANHTA